jgi:glutamine synthetase type III
MLRTGIVPAVRADAAADNAAGFKSKGIAEKAALAQQLLDATDALQTAFEQAHHKQRESARAAAVFASADLRAALNAARAVADQLEERVSNWPLPTINELTTAHHF